MPFVAMDCGAISRELAGSELFGHEKGSFTGAWQQKIGHFELANGGTIFLDEIANLPYDVQSSLLRVIQERKLKRIGGNKEIPFDVRIIIASNENLADAYKKGKFREDLYHRFNEFHITIPPLRERRSDIMFYANFFLQIANRELGKNLQGFEDDVISLFTNHSWYGNLREMKNIIRRAALLSDGRKIKIPNLPFDFAPYSATATNISSMTTEIPQNVQKDSLGESASSTQVEQPVYAVAETTSTTKELKPDLKSAALEAEYALILKVLKQVNFNKSKAAKILNVNRKTLYNKMKSLQLLNKEAAAEA
jgi:two-component system response regulator HydG